MNILIVVKILSWIKKKETFGKLASDVKPWLKYYDIDIEYYSDEKKRYLNTDCNIYDFF